MKKFILTWHSASYHKGIQEVKAEVGQKGFFKWRKDAASEIVDLLADNGIKSKLYKDGCSVAFTNLGDVLNAHKQLPEKYKHLMVHTEVFEVNLPF